MSIESDLGSRVIAKELNRTLSPKPTHEIHFERRSCSDLLQEFQ